MTPPTVPQRRDKRGRKPRRSLDRRRHNFIAYFSATFAISINLAAPPLANSAYPKITA